MTESFWKRTLWSGSASTGMEVCEEVCCATNIAGNTKREIRPIFMLKTPERGPRLEQAISYTDFCKGRLLGFENFAGT
jgi:hypothetical protein